MKLCGAGDAAGAGRRAGPATLRGYSFIMTRPDEETDRQTWMSFPSLCLMLFVFPLLAVLHSRLSRMSSSDSFPSYDNI